MSAAAWRLVWTWAGHRGTATDVDAQWTERTELYGGTSRRQVSVSFRPAGLSVAAVVEAGLHPAYGYGELYLGSLLVIAGPWLEVEYGVDGEPLTVTLSESADDDRGVWPPVSGVTRDVDASVDAWDDRRSGRITREGWALANDAAIGAAVPVVIGSPGSSSAPAVPAYVVLRAAPSVQVAVHAGRAAGSIRVWGVDQSAPGAGVTPTPIAAAATSALASGVDAFGSQVTLAVFASGASSGLDYTSGSVYATSWEAAEGVPGPAGWLIQEIALASSARIDHGSISAAASYLNGYRFDGYLDDRVSPLGLIQSQIAPLLPVSLISTTDGVGLVIWPWVDGQHHGSAHVIAGPGFALASRVRYEGSPMSSLSLSFGYNALTGLYTRTATASAGTSAHARLAMGVAGAALGRDEIQSRLIWSEATAGRIVQDRMSQLALPRRRIDYVCDPAIYGVGGSRELRVGQQIDLTDAALRLSRRSAVISGVERSATSLRVTCQLRDDALRWQ